MSLAGTGLLIPRERDEQFRPDCCFVKWRGTCFFYEENQNAKSHTVLDLSNTKASVSRYSITSQHKASDLLSHSFGQLMAYGIYREGFGGPKSCCIPGLASALSTVLPCSRLFPRSCPLTGRCHPDIHAYLQRKQRKTHSIQSMNTTQRKCLERNSSRLHEDIYVLDIAKLTIYIVCSKQ